MEIKKFKLLRGQSKSPENYNSHLTAYTTNHITYFGTSSLNEPRIDSNNEMERWYAENVYNDRLRREILSTRVPENDDKIFVNDVKLKYNLTIWNRIKTWWKYSMNKEEKINFCLLITLLIAIFSMLGYISYAHGILSEQLSKLK
jgi:hypothetical protein